MYSPQVPTISFHLTGRLDVTLPELSGLQFRKKFERAFESVEVGKRLAAQKVIQDPEVMIVGGRQVRGIWRVRNRDPLQLLQLLTGNRSDVKPRVVVLKMHLAHPPTLLAQGSS